MILPICDFQVMPCSKYNEWREEDILIFHQYIFRKQLQCMPVCRSSVGNMPYLVRLLILTPVPMVTVAQAPLYLNNISIGSLLVSKGMAKDIGVAEQVTMILKFMEDMGDFVFTLGNSNSSGVEIKELNESHVGESLDKSDSVLKIDSLELKSEEKEAVKMENPETSRREESLVSPKSECSDTESQHDLIVKGTEKGDSHQTGNEMPGNLPGIKEEAELDKVNTDKVEAAISTCGSMEMETVSNITEPDTTSDTKSVDTGFLSSDFNLNLDLNPQGHEVMLAHVKSPGHFYVHVISTQIGHTLDRLMKCLNQQFEKLTKKKLTRLSKSFKPEVSKLCCAQFTQDNCFYR